MITDTRAGGNLLARTYDIKENLIGYFGRGRGISVNTTNNITKDVIVSPIYSVTQNTAYNTAYVHRTLTP